MSRKNVWDERYAGEEFAYGTEPNDFLRENIHLLPENGKILCLADGEGRNSTFLARHGFEVTAVDYSRVGLEKAEKLADSYGVKINTEVADLADYDIAEKSYDGIISIFCHLLPQLREKVHRQVVLGLKPGGTLILESYTPAQLGRETGGPPVKELMFDLNMLKKDFAELQLITARETEREIFEGALHNGLGSVVQLVAQKS